MLQQAREMGSGTSAGHRTGRLCLPRRLPRAIPRVQNEVQMRPLVFAVAVLVAATPVVAPAMTSALNVELRQELLVMAREDQESATESATDPHNQTARALRSWQAHHRFERIHEIVAQYGWPGRSLVGEDGAHAAWLLVQHADSDPAFQRSCLDLMQAAFANGEVTARELSFLTDRVLLKEGKPQMYGTQGAIGAPSPEEEARIDANRLLLGLEPWHEFIENRRKHHDGWFPEVPGPAGSTPAASPPEPKP
jgi:hypothetical protein